MASEQAADQNIADEVIPMADPTPSEEKKPSEKVEASAELPPFMTGPPEPEVVLEPGQKLAVPLRTDIDWTKRRRKRTKEERVAFARQEKIRRDKEVAEIKAREEAEEIIRQEKIKFFKLDFDEMELVNILARKLLPPDISDLKIHVKIEEERWKEVMTGEKFLEYMKEKDKLSAKSLAHFLHRLGRRHLSNEGKWIQMICGDGIPEEDCKVEYFFALLAETLKLEENKHLLNELRYSTAKQPKKVGQLLLELVNEDFFRRNLIDFSCALDDRRAFRWKDKLQNRHIKGFHFYYKTEEEFKAKILDLAVALEAKEREEAKAPKEEKPQLMDTN